MYCICTNYLQFCLSSVYKTDINVGIMASQKGNTKTENACLTISLGKLGFPCFCISGNPSPPESGSLIAVLVVVLVSDSSAITELQVLTTTSGGEGIVWKKLHIQSSNNLLVSNIKCTFTRWKLTWKIMALCAEKRFMFLI